ncbi:MAG: phosphoglycerate kinase [Candidatus Dormiibacterota bacterium]
MGRRRLRTIRDLDLFEKRVLLRVDFNVPFDGDRILDDSRVRAAVPTIRALLNLGAEIRLVTHRGRPGGKVVPELNVAPLAVCLEEIVGVHVQVAPGVAGPPVELFLSEIAPGELVMLENVRFEPGEEANDPGFCRLLADLADAYVDDAFGAAHRAHASTEGVGHLLPSAAGLLMEKEVTVLSQVLDNPREPLVAIVGGAKISTKIGVMENLMPRVSAMLVGGAMACTVLKADGADVGDSKVEEDQLDTARRLLEAGREKVALPVDAVVADAFSADANIQVVDARRIPAGWMMLDIGPETQKGFAMIAEDEAGTIVWNGPLGVYEMEPFRAGTEAVARAVAKSPAISVIGGGDLAAALAQLGLEDSMTHVSTGGGATLEFLEGKDLPGIRVLEED